MLSLAPAFNTPTSFLVSSKRCTDTGYSHLPRARPILRRNLPRRRRAVHLFPAISSDTRHTRLLRPLLDYVTELLAGEVQVLVPARNYPRTSFPELLLQGTSPWQPPHKRLRWQNCLRMLLLQWRLRSVSFFLMMLPQPNASDRTLKQQTLSRSMIRLSSLILV
jgi:hypothetical protein